MKSLRHIVILWGIIGLMASAYATPGAKKASQAKITTLPALMDNVTLAVRMHAIQQMEIQAGELAKIHASSWKLRELADRIARDQKFADKKLQNFIGDLDAPENQSLVDRKKLKANAEKIANLQKLEALAFDKEFLSVMQQGHSEAIALLTEARSRLKRQTEMWRWVTKSLPILKQHHELSQTIHVADNS